MARRMFSTDITTSDAFLDMPQSAQNLYFHLGMNADDDGFIGSPRMVMRTLGSAQNDYEILIAKKFILHLEKGVCVVKHWRINNQIRKDRYKETKYLEQKSTLFIKPNGSYTQSETKGLPLPNGHFIVENVEENESGNQQATNWQPLGDAGKVSKGKVRLNKNSKRAKLNSSYEEKFEIFWKIYPEKVGKGKAYETWVLLEENIKDTCVTAIQNQVDNNHFYKDWLKKDSVPHGVTWLNQRRWEDVVKKIERKGDTDTTLVTEHSKTLLESRKQKTIKL